MSDYENEFRPDGELFELVKGVINNAISSVESTLDDTVLVRKRDMFDAFAKAANEMHLNGSEFHITAQFGAKVVRILFDDDIKNESEETEDD